MIPMQLIEALKPDVLVDARMRKRSLPEINAILPH